MTQMDDTATKSLIRQDELNTQDVIQQVAKIQEIMKAIMKEDEHYGVIPGCHKPSLLKPGAEKLGLTFRLVPEFRLERFDLPGNHREYEVICLLTHAPTGQIMGSGVGSCNTMEAKYRFRTGEVTDTGNPVPKEYWNERDKKFIGGKGYGTKKVNGKWHIVIQGEKIEHDNPADYWNTILKMAKKRAHVDAILTATAASDIFTQDDMEDVINGDTDNGKKKSPDDIKPTTEKGGRSEVISEPQRKRLYAISKKRGLTDEELKAIVLAAGYEHGTEIQKKDYEQIVLNVEGFSSKVADERPEDDGLEF